MSGLFAQLYFDEDVSALVARLVRLRGFAVTTTQEAGHAGGSDEQQLVYAAQHQMVIVTHNRVHFEALATRFMAEGRSHSGIVVAVRRPPHELAQRLLTLLDSFTADEMDKLLVYI